MRKSTQRREPMSNERDIQQQLKRGSGHALHEDRRLLHNPRSSKGDGATQQDPLRDGKGYRFIKKARDRLSVNNRVTLSPYHTFRQITESSIPYTQECKITGVRTVLHHAYCRNGLYRPQIKLHHDTLWGSNMGPTVLLLRN